MAVLKIEPLCQFGAVSLSSYSVSMPNQRGKRTNSPLFLQDRSNLSVRRVAFVVIRCSNGSSPADGDSHGFRRTGTWTDHLRAKPTCLKHVEESITGRYGPCCSKHTHTHRSSYTLRQETKCDHDNLSWLQAVYYRVFYWIRNLNVYLHGLAPSATISMRKELRLMSLWSLWASRDQCMSLDFNTATRAGRRKGRQIDENHLISTSVRHDC